MDELKHGSPCNTHIILHTIVDLYTNKTGTYGTTITYTTTISTNAIHVVLSVDTQSSYTQNLFNLESSAMVRTSKVLTKFMHQTGKSKKLTSL